MELFSFAYWVATAAALVMFAIDVVFHCVTEQMQGRARVLPFTTRMGVFKLAVAPGCAFTPTLNAGFAVALLFWFALGALEILWFPERVGVKNAR